MLETAHRAYTTRCARAEARSTATGMGGKKAEDYLAFLQMMNSGDGAGLKSLRNVRQVAYVLGFYLTVRRDVHQGFVVG
jgi:hypothetical protein